MISAIAFVSVFFSARRSDCRQTHRAVAGRRRYHDTGHAVRLEVRYHLAERLLTATRW
jgi:hypothetical protein